jgi:hypothetical protein
VLEIPYGYCQCGCGGKTTIPTVNSSVHGRVKGKPLNFINHHNFKANLSEEERFWSRVNIKGPDECWPWKAGVFSYGYGAFYFRQKQQKASRVAWILKKREIPDGLFVLHKCDNPPCCNSNHHFLGTQLDNMRDMISKNRQNFVEGLALGNPSRWGKRKEKL